MKAHYLLPLLAALPAAVAEPAAHSAEYEAGMAAIAKLQEANLAYVQLAASIDNKAEAWMRRKAVTAAYRCVDAAVWELHRLRCPADIGEAAELEQAFGACFEPPAELRAAYRRFAEARGYGQFFWLECLDSNFSRPIGNVLHFSMLARELDGLDPKGRAEYDHNMAVVGLIQQLDAELRALTRENLEERRASIERLQEELVALPVTKYLHVIDPRDQMSALWEYQAFMLNTSFYSLMVQYHLLREDALPKDARLAPLLKPLEGFYASQGYDASIPPGAMKDACFGVPKDRW